MESLPAPRFEDESEGADPSSDPSSAGSLTAINRALASVRDCMVLRVWETSVSRGFDVIPHLENLGRAVSLIEQAGLVPAGLFDRVLGVAAASDIEVARRDVVVWAKAEMLEHVASLTRDLKPVQMGLLVNSVHDAACLLFECALVSRLYNVMRANASMKDVSRNRRLVRPRFVAPDGTVLKIVDDYRKSDPDVVLAEALAKKRELARRIAWARRRKALAAKGALPRQPTRVPAPPFSPAVFQSILSRWGAKLDVPDRPESEPDLLSPSGAV